MNLLAELGRLQAVAFELPKKTPRALLSHLPRSIKELSLTPNDRTSADIDLDPILRFDALSSLSLDAYERDLDKILPALKHLRTLALRSAKKVRTLDVIAGLTGLRSLLLQQLGALIDISVLSSLTDLRALQLWRLAKVASVDVLSTMGTLEFLFLETMNTVRRFPDATKMRKLRVVKLAAMKLLRDFSALERAPALQEFVFQKADYQRPDDFLPVLRNRSLKRAGFGYQKKADVARMTASCRSTALMLRSTSTRKSAATSRSERGRRQGTLRTERTPTTPRPVSRTRSSGVVPLPVSTG